MAPNLMQPRFLNHPAAAGSSRLAPRPQSPYPLLRLPTALPAGIQNVTTKTTSNSLAIIEDADRLAALPLDAQSEGPSEEPPSLIRGFKATIPSSEMAKQRRRLVRGGLVDQNLGNDRLGLKKLGDRARGLLTDRADEEPDSLGVGRKTRRRKKAREARRISEGRVLEGKLHLEDLVQQADEIAQDKENLAVRTVSPSFAAKLGC